MTAAVNEQFVLLPLRDVVIVPKMVVTLYVGRSQSIMGLQEVENQDRLLFVVTQRQADCDDPACDDLFFGGYGLPCHSSHGSPGKHQKSRDEKDLVEGLYRAKLHDIKPEREHQVAIVEPLMDQEDHHARLLLPNLEQMLLEYAEISDVISADSVCSLKALDDPGAYADLVAIQLSIPIEEKQDLLELLSPQARVERVIYLLERDTMRIKNHAPHQGKKLKNSLFVNKRKSSTRKPCVLTKTELGIEDDPASAEVRRLEKQINLVNLPQEVAKKLRNELNKLKIMPSMSAEAAVIRHYLEQVLALPWGQYKSLNHDLTHATESLDLDHYGLQDVKDRVLDIISVQMRSKSARGNILCLVGPPGVGKSSLAKSIAEATGRDFVRIALGGVRDESEIRGHRRTYIGAMPGRIIKSLARVKSDNCLILLDEIDKMGMDFRGDPASALLEVLDPEQNATFHDHYLEVDYDLSHVLFVTTANSMEIPHALMDRMEIVRLSGYTYLEKLHIAKRHLIPRVMQECSLTSKDIAFRDSALELLLRSYTREAGVRELNRILLRLARKVVRLLAVNDRKGPVPITTQWVKRYLGAERFKWEDAHEQDVIGCVKGLAWTAAGGDMLSVEVVILPGKGELIYTGSLGDVMKESIRAALSLVRDKVKADVEPLFFKEHDIHVHIPEGATPVDGPSAGITIATALLSAVKRVPVKATVSMTGEVTLLGGVLKIGGLKEKLLAAQRGGVKTVIVPEANQGDLKEIPRSVIKQLDVVLVNQVEQVFAHALCSE